MKRNLFHIYISYKRHTSFWALLILVILSMSCGFNVVTASISSFLNSISMIKLKIRDLRETLNYRKATNIQLQ